MRTIVHVVLRLRRIIAGLMLLVAAIPIAAASGNPSKFVVLDNSDAGFTTVGTWGSVDTNATLGPTYGYDARTITSAASTTASATWALGSFPTATGSFGIDVFIPAIASTVNTAAVYRLDEQAGCTGGYSTIVTFPPHDQNNATNEGQFRRIGTATLQFGNCYHVVPVSVD